MMNCTVCSEPLDTSVTAGNCPVCGLKYVLTNNKVEGIKMDKITAEDSDKFLERLHLLVSDLLALKKRKKELMKDLGGQIKDLDEEIAAVNSQLEEAKQKKAEFTVTLSASSSQE